MITHKTFKTLDNEWVMPKDVVTKDGKLLKNKTGEKVQEGQVKKCLNLRKML